MRPSQHLYLFAPKILKIFSEHNYSHGKNEWATTTR